MFMNIIINSLYPPKFPHLGHVHSFSVECFYFFCSYNRFSNLFIFFVQFSCWFNFVHLYALTLLFLPQIAFQQKTKKKSRANSLFYIYKQFSNYQKMSRYLLFLFVQNVSHIFRYFSLISLKICSWHLFISIMIPKLTGFDLFSPTVLLPPPLHHITFTSCYIHIYNHYSFISKVLHI